jgi:hypothetical protein
MRHSVEKLHPKERKAGLRNLHELSYAPGGNYDAFDSTSHFSLNLNSIIAAMWDRNDYDWMTFEHKGLESTHDIALKFPIKVVKVVDNEWFAGLA